MRHQDCTINHILESWTYPNAAARTGATGFVAGDIGRVAYQTDTGQYWRLTGNSPVAWQLVTGAASSKNTSQALPGNPSGTTSTSGVMMGLAALFTPVGSGIVRVTVSGSIANNAASGGVKPTLRYGTGTPPTNGAGPVGTAAGNSPQIINSSATAGLRTPFFLEAVISGLTLGTAYWFDLLVAAVSAGTANVYDLSIAILEL